MSFRTTRRRPVSWKNAASTRRVCCASTTSRTAISLMRGFSPCCDEWVKGNEICLQSSGDLRLHTFPRDCRPKNFFWHTQPSPMDGPVCRPEKISVLGVETAELGQRLVGGIRQVLRFGPRHRGGCFHNQHGPGSSLTRVNLLKSHG